jgi:hypothetical protein
MIDVEAARFLDEYFRKVLIARRWAREYSATTVSPRHVPPVLRYLDQQAAHHPGEGL